MRLEPLKRQLWATACAMLMLSWVPASAAAPSAGSDQLPQTTILRQHTSILVNGSSEIEVRLTEDAHLSSKVRFRRADGPNRDITFQGAKGATTFALLPTDYAGAPQTGRYLIGGRFPDCFDQACDRTSGYLNHLLVGSKGLVKKGTYILRASSESPTKLTLLFSGLPAGDVELRPDASTFADFGRPPSSEVAQGGLTEWAAGQTFHAGRVGMSISILHLQGDGLRPLAYGICQHDVIPPPSDGAYGPQCAAATTAAFFLWTPVVETESEIVLIATFIYHDQGEVDLESDSRGLGAWAVTEGNLERASFQGIFLDLTS